ncbi:hypothetical protein JOF48_003610 [Arthrobacter stackebrandtii]|uniref:Potassium channel domain-containing protein n=1 Tax=Arthrobacter stackebrandtii TaxID=272161 RepID=A0ABS4Z188_9MICC|nr:ion channel [Arthrobacter stackebrandtii]MBP2414811.1 hypothetical protein [Arthrobacter stackebrandtii]
MTGRALTGWAAFRQRKSAHNLGSGVALLLLACSYGFSAAQDSPEPSEVALLFQLVTVVVILRVTDVRTLVMRLAALTAFAAGVAVLGVAVAGSTGHLLDAMLSATPIVAYMLAAVAIGVHESHKSRVDGQTLLAAVAMYVLLGIVFAFVYNFIALVMQVPLFSSGEPNSLTSQSFFSFTTLTTTGYGDKVPVGPVVQSMAILEAVVGTLFLVIAMARVVSAWKPAPRRDPEAPNREQWTPRRGRTRLQVQAGSAMSRPTGGRRAVCTHCGRRRPVHRP